MWILCGNGASASVENPSRRGSTFRVPGRRPCLDLSFMWMLYVVSRNFLRLKVGHAVVVCHGWGPFFLHLA